jgi:hypothetical protein
MTTITICSDNSAPNPGVGLTLSPNQPRSTCWTIEYNPQWHGNTPNQPPSTGEPDNPPIDSTPVSLAGTAELFALGVLLIIGASFLERRRTPIYPRRASL